MMNFLLIMISIIRKVQTTIMNTLSCVCVRVCVCVCQIGALAYSKEPSKGPKLAVLMTLSRSARAQLRSTSHSL